VFRDKVGQDRGAGAKRARERPWRSCRRRLSQFRLETAPEVRTTRKDPTPEALAHNMAMVEKVRAVAEAKRVTPGQIALAWLLALEPWIVPIPGTTKPHRLAENAAAADVVLTADEVAQLTAVSDSIEVIGGRYPDVLEAQTNL
jgi:aryl-alcohol dehydrogenase-like predicted oxidoreductase